MTTHTDLIARLREMAGRLRLEAANALEALEQQVAALTKELQKRDKCSYMGPMRDCPTHGIGPEIAAAQAREAKLREALVDYDNQASEYDGRTSKELGDRIKSLIALPTDGSALQERLKQEREQLIDDWTTTIATCYKSDDLLTAEQVVDLLCPSDKKADAIRGLA